LNTLESVCYSNDNVKICGNKYSTGLRLLEEKLLFTLTPACVDGTPACLRATHRQAYLLPSRGCRKTPLVIASERSERGNLINSQCFHKIASLRQAQGKLFTPRNDVYRQAHQREENIMMYGSPQ